MPKKKKENLTPEELDRQRALGRMRMRILARLVIENSDWLYTQALPGGDVLGENVMHNVAMMWQRKHKAAGEFATLSLSQKQVMRKLISRRTDEEKRMLFRFMGGLKCFRRYPIRVSRQISGCVYYAYYKADRIMIQEGRLAIALYYILSGDLVETRREYDPVDKVYVDRKVGLINEADLIGEMALLHGVPWNTTVRTLSKVEVLYVLRHDFNEILRKTVQDSWDRIKRAMDQFSYFRKFNEIEMQECCVAAKVKLYKPTQTIYGHGKGSKLDVYFILSGVCTMVDFIKTEVSEIRGYKHYSLIEDKALPVKQRKPRTDKKKRSVIFSMFGAADHLEYDRQAVSRDSTLPKPAPRNRTSTIPEVRQETFFVQICDMTSGCLFGLEDSYPNRAVIATTKVVCLVVPRHWLLQHHRDIWEAMRHMLNSFLPEPAMVFEKFLADRKWAAIGQRIMSDVMSRVRLVNTDTNEADIPRATRIYLQPPDET